MPGSWAEDSSKRASNARLERARELRRALTEPEKRLWWHLRNRLPVSGSHFRRQVPIGSYITDFCCLATKLIVDVDGEQHGLPEHLAYDERRMAYLNSQGFRVLRFSNRDVMLAVDIVMDTIYAAVCDTTPTPDRASGATRPSCRAEPGPQGGGEVRTDRRALLTGGIAALLASALPRPALAQDPETHGLAIFGDLRYPAEFPHFGYVRPDAPKGGAFSLQIAGTAGNQTFDTFNTLNIHVLKGDGAAGMGLTFESLMVRALDEPDAMYGLVARAVRLSPDRRTCRFLLRPEARFHDGSRLTAQDVAFSIRILKEKGHPAISQALRHVASAEQEGDGVLRVDFATEGSRDLPLVVAGLPIFSAASWAGRDFEAATLEAPLGSGPYRVGRFEVGRFITFARVRDHWARALPVNVGQHNVDEIRYEYFRDRQVAFEGFKAGTFTFREEFTARIWATGYDFPAVTEGRVRRETVPDGTPSGMQGWFFNLRRPRFADPRIREAIGLAFDFEWVNATIMHGAYARTASYFENAPLKAEGLPSPAELALLEPFRGRVPDAVFGEAYRPPRSDGSGQDRTLLRRASQLLGEAGCRRDGSVLRLPSGEPLAAEFLDFQPVLQPHTQPFIKNLALLGIQATSRIVDAAQYQRRMEEFDFDLTVRRYANAATPGEAIRQIFGSAAAATRGSPNIAGIASPAVDALVETILSAESREALTTACRALDRVLRAGHHWVPMWFRASRAIAYWDVFGHPPVPPAYDLGAPQLWWHDAEKARRIGLG